MNWVFITEERNLDSFPQIYKNTQNEPKVLRDSF